MKAAHPVNYFPGFLGKIIKNYPPSKLFLFTSLPEIISTYTFKILKALKLCILPHLIYFCYTRGRCLGPLSRALPLDPIRGHIYYRRAWIPLVGGSCTSFQAIPKSWKPWLWGGTTLLDAPFFSLQWPNIYNSSGKGFRTGKVGGIDMIIAHFYHKIKMERWEEYT